MTCAADAETRHEFGGTNTEVVGLYWTIEEAQCAAKRAMLCKEERSEEWEVEGKDLTREEGGDQADEDQSQGEQAQQRTRKSDEGLDLDNDSGRVDSTEQYNLSAVDDDPLCFRIMATDSMGDEESVWIERFQLPQRLQSLIRSLPRAFASLPSSITPAHLLNSSFPSVEKIPQTGALPLSVQPNVSIEDTVPMQAAVAPAAPIAPTGTRTRQPLQSIPAPQASAPAPAPAQAQASSSTSAETPLPKTRVADTQQVVKHSTTMRVPRKRPQKLYIIKHLTQDQGEGGGGGDEHEDLYTNRAYESLYHANVRAREALFYDILGAEDPSSDDGDDEDDDSETEDKLDISDWCQEGSEENVNSHTKPYSGEAYMDMMYCSDTYRHEVQVQEITVSYSSTETETVQIERPMPPVTAPVWVPRTQAASSSTSTSTSTSSPSSTCASCAAKRKATGQVPQSTSAPASKRKKTTKTKTKTKRPSTSTSIPTGPNAKRLPPGTIIDLCSP